MNQYCPPVVLHNKDIQRVPVPLPTAMQIEPIDNSNWEIQLDLLSDTRLVGACFIIHSSKSNITIYSGAKCSKWENKVVWPRFIRGSNHWYNLYTLFITLDKQIATIRLNQQHASQIKQNIADNIKVVAMNRYSNSSTVGPLIRFHNIIMMTNDCIALTSCEGNDDGWSYTSVSPNDTINLFYDARNIKIKVVHSVCFPEYVIGIINVKERDLIRLFIKYIKQDNHHTLTAYINNTIIFSHTTPNYLGKDCSTDWFFLAVYNSPIIINCNTNIDKKNDENDTTIEIRNILLILCLPLMLLLITLYINPKTKKRVKFDKCPPTVHRLVVWGFAQQSARDGKCWIQCGLDRARFKRRIQETDKEIGWVFKTKHRDMVASKLIEL